jgi:hypothetical protein
MHWARKNRIFRLTKFLEVWPPLLRSDALFRDVREHIVLVMDALFCGLFNESSNSSAYTASDVRIIVNNKLKRLSKENGSGAIWDTIPAFTWTDWGKPRKCLSQCNRSLGRDLIPVLPKHKPLDCDIRCGPYPEPVPSSSLPHILFLWSLTFI